MSGSIAMDSLSLPVARLRVCSVRRSRLSRSASISSVSIVSASATGLMRPSTWVMSSVFEAAQHMHDGVDFADIGEELVAEAFALRRAAHQAGDVDEGDARRDQFLRLGDVGKLAHARIGNRHFTGVRLDRAERIIRRLRRRRLGQRVEESGLADIRQPDDTAFETHGTLSIS